MEKLKKKRSAVRASFSKTAKLIHDELKKVAFDKNIIMDKSTKLEGIMNDLKVLDENILDALLDSVDETEIIKETEACEEYSDEFITLNRVVRECLNDKKNPIDDVYFDSRSVASANNRCYKLPKIEISKFDGQLINWLPFWAQFQKIDSDDNLDDGDKFHYLSQSMQSGSRAQELVDSYPMSRENYPKVIQALKERFGKKDLLVEVYVRELIQMIMVNVKNNSNNRYPLCKFYDKIEAHLRSLDSMGLKLEENASWLYPMVESCLSEDILRSWQRSFTYNSDSTEKTSRLNKLLQFLKAEVEGEERLKLARSGFDVPSKRDNSYKDIVKDNNKKKGISTAAGLFAGKELICIFCDKGHESKDCFRARSWTLEKIKDKIKGKKACFKCFKLNHVVKNCNAKICCHVCSRTHHLIMCPDLANKDSPSQEVSQINDEPNSAVHTSLSNMQCTSEVALMTLEILVKGNNGYKRIRTILDTGSQRSYIKEDTARELGLMPVDTENVAHTLFGGTHLNSKLYKKFSVELTNPSKKGRPIGTFNFLGQPKICGDIPRIQLSAAPFLKELKKHGIWLSDMGPGATDIEMLIGSDIYGKILTGKVTQLQGGMTAVETKLGWTVCGTTDEFEIPIERDTSVLLSNLAIKEFKVSDLWDLETIGVTDPGEAITKAEEDENAQLKFQSSIHKNEEGRYCVNLPWHEGPVEIPSNRQMAEKRLFSTTRRLKNTSYFQEYDAIFQEWIAEKVIEKVPIDESEKNNHYLAHHPVIKPGSLTTKVRPVFDASCKISRAPSLNDCLVKGPNLLEQIPAILLRFRETRIGVTSDIRRAFLQIEVAQEDRDYLRFLWWSQDNQVQVYRHNRVVFGLTCSPFLLGAVITHHLARVEGEMQRTAQQLSRSLYVDNCVTSLDNAEDLEQFVLNSTKIMQEAKMDLRMWESGPHFEIERSSIKSRSVEESISNQEIPVLGLKWDRNDDTLVFNFKVDLPTVNPSKRDILSLTQAIFDPIGVLTSVLLPAKLLIQKAWIAKTDWDAPLPDEVREQFVKRYQELHCLKHIKISRRFGYGDPSKWSIHVFCDASQNAYATAIFIRCEGNQVVVSLLGAKSRLAPMKRMTIPRLELLACVIGTRLAKFINEALKIPNIPSFFWTDSTTTLAWIKRNDQWGTFVGNRVREITKYTRTNQWFYVPGSLNPAELPSRGCSPQQFVESHWWEGPDWLYSSPDGWPNSEGCIDEDQVTKERRVNVQTNVAASSPTQSLLGLEKFSRFSKMIRVMGYVLRFIAKIRKKSDSMETCLTPEEREEAETSLWRLVQRDCFPEAGQVVKKLVVIKDPQGLIRVQTKIIDRSDDYNFRYPILLPSKHLVVDCLIRDYHLLYCHAGVQILASRLREKFWIISSKRNIRRVITKCVHCKRFTSKALDTPPIHLPLDRIREANVFEITGIDLCGPLYLKIGKKTWVVLFTCAVYRAIHLELASSLTTQSFLQCFRRFITRRGRPSVVYTDNGTNFIGSKNLLAKVDWDTLQADEHLSPIRWKFIPPTAAWWGGWWERLIRIVKELLVRVLGRSSLMYEELYTVLCDIEATVNCRPLTYVSEDSKDLIPLTPSMFLQEVKEVGVPDFDVVDHKSLNDRHKHCQNLRENLRSRFTREYLGQLVQRAKEVKRELQIGEIVLVDSENRKRQLWPIAKIVKIMPSRDGHARVVELKTTNGALTWPIQKLYPLEVSTVDDPLMQNFPTKRSRFGRELKTTKKLDL